MARVAVDFGTSSTVIAWSAGGSTGPDVLSVPEISVEVTAPPRRGARARPVHVVPTCIHYGAAETLLGSQVLSRDLGEHADTLRWMKRGIAYGVQKRRKTAQGYKSPGEAGRDFLETILKYVSHEFSFEDDEFTFTVPVESFDTFRDWVELVAESCGIQRLRLIDEPTAAVLAYRGCVRPDERFLIFDFGCGTLDVSVVRIDLASGSEKKAVQLGQAGRDLGGMDIDRWIAEDFRERCGLDAGTYRFLEPAILREAERLKIALCSAGGEGVLAVNSLAPNGAEIRAPYTASCDACGGGRGAGACTGIEGCLGCIFGRRGLLGQIRDTVDRALENAAVKAGVRRRDISRAIVTGGSSLLPVVREFLHESFEGKVDYENPFDAVVRGACRGLVVPLLQHDYAIESYSRKRRDYEFKPLFAAGTEYPTAPHAVRFWAKGSYDGMTRIGIRIFEVSGLKKRTLETALVDSDGVLVDAGRVASEYHYICLNRGNPTFILADPPVDLGRDAKRFLCSFRVDGTRRLCVTVEDRLSGTVLLEDHPVVRL